jgi:hypothetical protein
MMRYILDTHHNFTSTNIIGLNGIYVGIIRFVSLLLSVVVTNLIVSNIYWLVLDLGAAYVSLAVVNVNNN